jgi:cell shape-determining protein MreC
VTGKGLIGKVVQVSDDRCTVELITSGNYNVGFNVVGTPAVGVAQGIGSPTVLRGVNIDVSLSSKVEVGSIVVTGGTRRSSFPPDLPVGTVAAVQTDDAARETKVDITLFARTTDLTYADVVLWQPEP